MNNKLLDYDEFLNWRVRMKTTMSSKVEGTIRDFQGSTLVLSDVIISYETGRNRYLSSMEIEKEEISDLSVLSSSLKSPSPPSQPLPEVEPPKIIKTEAKEEKEKVVINPVVVASKVTEKKEIPLVEVVYNSKKQQPIISTKNQTEKPPQNSIPWLESNVTQIKNKEFDIQFNLKKFDKNKEFEKLKVNCESFYNDFKKKEVSFPEPSSTLYSGGTEDMESSQTDYDPSSIIKDACKKQKSSLPIIYELGGRELASIIINHSGSPLKRILFVLGSPFYSEFALSSLQHLYNRDYKIFSYPVKVTKENADLFTKASQVFKRYDVITNQNLFPPTKDFDVIVSCRDTDSFLIESKQLLSGLRDRTKLFSLGSDNTFTSQKSEILFFGLVEDTSHQSSKNSGRLIDIGLPKDVYLELGINYPFAHDSFSIPISL
jgi:hypothetical protein